MSGWCGLCWTKSAGGINIMLIGASVNGHVECIKALLNKGADVNYRDQMGVAVNIQSETMYSYRNRRGYTPLMHAAEAGKENCLKFLVQTGAEVNLSNEDGDTAIIAASKGGNFNVMKFLLESGADVNAVGTLGNTALMEAARNSNENCVKLLCDSGANVNRIDRGSYSALLLATVNSHHKNIEVLTKAGACVNTTELRGKTALIIADESDIRRKLCTGRQPIVNGVVARKATDWSKFSKRCETGNSIGLYLVSECIIKLLMSRQMFRGSGCWGC